MDFSYQTLKNRCRKPADHLIFNARSLAPVPFEETPAPFEESKTTEKSAWDDRLWTLTVNFRDPAGIVPKFDLLTIDHSRSPFLCIIVVVAVEIESPDVIPVTANNLRSVVRP
jgi:hypothetical protein